MMKWVFFRHEVNQGKAAAIRTALQHATAELAVTHDADLEYHPLDLLKLIQVFLDERTTAKHSLSGWLSTLCRQTCRMT